jgi:prephenate dehydrogenase
VRVAVLGTGLIGGSIGLAARARAGARVCAFDPDPAALQEALRVGAIDEAAPDIATAVAGAQVVFAAAPVGALAQTVSEALAHCGPDCAVSDVGSTKLALEELREDPRFIGGHPLAGAETAGVQNAREDLFAGATWYLTPTAASDPELCARLSDLIERFGASPIAVRADAHDRLMARVSHLPHVLANVLVAQALDAFERERSNPGAGPSLRDAVRVAGANTGIWTDIYLANSDALIEAIDETMKRLGEVRATLADADADRLAAWNERAGSARRRLLGENPAAAPGPRHGSLQEDPAAAPGPSDISTDP